MASVHIVEWNHNTGLICSSTGDVGEFTSSNMTSLTSPGDEMFEMLQNLVNAILNLFNQMNVDVNTKGKGRDTILHYACDNINKLPIEIFNLLIETHGCDVNALDNDKRIPIHRALDQVNPRNGGDINVLAYLINQKNIDVNIKDRKGFNSLHLACIGNLQNQSVLWN